MDAVLLACKIDKWARDTEGMPPEWYAALRNAAQWLMWSEHLHARQNLAAPAADMQEGLFRDAAR